MVLEDNVSLSTDVGKVGVTGKVTAYNLVLSIAHVALGGFSQPLWVFREIRVRQAGTRILPVLLPLPL